MDDSIEGCFGRRITASIEYGGYRGISRGGCASLTSPATDTGVRLPWTADHFSKERSDEQNGQGET